ncbi:MAG: efflux RND transporter periplasmic adaptor subunit [Bacteroidia bacterium]|nr:efflux RND transporter periplasmic adaptor subunit [Bacteroidia bacterium]
MAAKNNPKYRLYGIILLLVLIGASIWFWLVHKNKDIEVETSVVATRTIIERITESGIIQPNIELPIAPEVSGEIVALYVQEGDYVKVGDKLFDIKPDNYQAALEQATASLNGARSDYANTQAAIAQAEANVIQDSLNLARNTKLFEQKVISQVDLENFQLKYRISLAQYEVSKQAAKAAFYRIQSAEAVLKQAKENLSRTSIRATLNGTITKLTAELGQRVVGTGQFQGTEILKIADLRDMELKADINENDIVKVTLGDTAEIEVDAYPNRIFKGVVREIAYSANMTAAGTTDQVTNFPVKVAIIPDSYRNDTAFMRGLAAYQSPFRPGMSAVVNIFTNTKSNVIAIPIQAVTLEKKSEVDSKTPANTDSPKEIVYLFNNGNTKMTSVTTGISDDQFIEIKSGLKVGEIIISGPYTVISKELRENQKVVLKKDKQ